MTLKHLSVGALGALLIAAPASAADFKTDILPMLESKCMGCHRAPYKTSTGRTKKPKGKLRLDNPEEIAKGGSEGDAVVAKDAAKSLVYTRVTLDKDHDDFMPPQGEGKPEPLTAAELTALKAWIEAGADYGDWKGTEFNDDGTKK
jgi:hypothetical protein